jgi:hypothetical protein
VLSETGFSPGHITRTGRSGVDSTSAVTWYKRGHEKTVLTHKRALGGSLKANYFLRAKHWQIFLLLFALPTILEVAAIGVIPTRIRSWHDFGRGGLFLLGVMVLYFLCFLAWFGSMGFFFRSIVKPEFRMGTQLFRFALIYPVVYVPIFFLMVIPEPGAPAWVILPLHLACMACLFYLLYFVSKNLVLAETGKHVSFYEYAGPFFLLWFFPIGIWIIQPKVNRLYAERSGTEMFSEPSAVKS